MAKKGLFTFITGVAVGAAALFLSKKENRDKAQQYADVTRSQIEHWAKQYNEDPEAFKEDMLTKGRKLAESTMKQIQEKAAELKKQSKIDDKARDLVREAKKEAAVAVKTAEKLKKSSKLAEKSEALKKEVEKEATAVKKTVHKKVATASKAVKKKTTTNKA